MSDLDPTTEPATETPAPGTPPVDEWTAAVSAAMDEADPVQEEDTPDLEDDVEDDSAEVDEEISDEVDDDVEDEPAEDDADADDEADTEAVSAPDHWSDAAKAAFADLPEGAQQALLDQENATAAGLQQREQDLEQREGVVNALSEVFQPYSQQMQAAGADPVSTMKQLLSANDYLMKEPKNGIRWLAQQFNVDLIDLVTDEEPHEVDPQVKQLQQQVQQLTQTLTNQQQQEVSQIRQQAVNAVEEFRTAKAPDGSLLHPFFDDVRQEAGKLVAAGAAATIEEAYERAVWANPTTRAKLVKQQQDAEKAAAKAKARTARKKARIPSSTPGNLRNQRQTPTTWEDAIRQAMDSQDAA